MTRMTTEQRAAAAPSIAAPVAPVMYGLVDRRVWLGEPANPCSGDHGTTGFTAKRSTRPLRRPST